MTRAGPKPSPYQKCGPLDRVIRSSRPWAGPVVRVSALESVAWTWRRDVRAHTTLVLSPGPCSTSPELFIDQSIPFSRPRGLIKYFAEPPDRQRWCHYGPNAPGFCIYCRDLHTVGCWSGSASMFILSAPQNTRPMVWCRLRHLAVDGGYEGIGSYDD